MSGEDRDLESPDWLLRVRAVERLGTYGEPALAALARALEDENTAVTEAAVDVLVATGTPGARELLLRALECGDDESAGHIYFFLSALAHPVADDVIGRYEQLAR